MNDQLLKVAARIYCPECFAVHPTVVSFMADDDKNDHDSADLLCGKCRFIVATLHAAERGEK